jgi:hypothetical protein
MWKQSRMCRALNKSIMGNTRIVGNARKVKERDATIPGIDVGVGRGPIGS